ncbi:MAG: hypothetical protein E7306_14250 [Butyrivibrio sp.]|nr:hypothetical protein [Butyrivibrio sp.]
MKYGMNAKNLILHIIVLAIILGGIFFDAGESLELSDRIGYILNTDEADATDPLTASYYVNYNEAKVLSAAEIKDVSVLTEVIKKLERSSSNKRIVVLTLILCFFLSIGIFFKSNLPSIFPWTNVICSRNSVMVFIHDQDGLK